MLKARGGSEFHFLLSAAFDSSHSSRVSLLPLLFPYDEYFYTMLTTLSQTRPRVGQAAKEAESLLVYSFLP
jgi:hypothetical protein